ncbi:hypothetical protein GCM10017673_55910 [Streptosporangium violaceochromogenes]|nr:hypothetical protein GCM10017673_55910 [Streptosporangium violaceochromogenes]
MYECTNLSVWRPGGIAIPPAGGSGSEEGGRIGAALIAVGSPAAETAKPGIPRKTGCSGRPYCFTMRLMNTTVTLLPLIPAVRSAWKQPGRRGGPALPRL